MEPGGGGGGGADGLAGCEVGSSSPAAPRLFGTGGGAGFLLLDTTGGAFGADPPAVGGGGVGGTPFGPPPLPASRMKSCIKSLFSSIWVREMPIPCSCDSKRSQLGSTFSDVKPFSLSKPMCATRLNSVGPEIRALLIGPFFLLARLGERVGAEKEGVEKWGIFDEPPDLLFLATIGRSCQLGPTKGRLPDSPAITLRLLTFLFKSEASPSSEKAIPIMQSCEDGRRQEYCRCYVCSAHIARKRVEEGPILVPLEAFVELVLPDNAACALASVRPNQHDCITSR